MAERPPRPGFSFPGPPPREALTFFRRKDLRVGFSYQDVWLEEHTHAFTVAKATRLDLLDDIRTAVDTALSEGQTFRQFQKGLTPVLQARGWWGKKTVRDPRTGRLVRAQLGSRRRLRVIYSANLRSARAAGQWERAQRTKRALPFLLYQLGPSEKHRPEHVQWAGTILPVDDVWWRTHYPPNGWGCKCWVRQISRREAERRGGRSTRPEAQPVPRINKRTGEERMVDRGLDPSWATNPGQHRARVLAEGLHGRLQRADEQFARAAVRDVVDSPILAGFLRQVRGFHKKRPAARGVSRPIEARIGEIPVAVVRAPTLKTLRAVPRARNAPSAVVRLSPDTGLKQLKHEQLTVVHYRILPELIEHGEGFLLDSQKLVFYGKFDGHLYRAIVKSTGKGELYLTTFHRVAGRHRRRHRRRLELVQEGRR